MSKHNTSKSIARGLRALLIAGSLALAATLSATPSAHAGGPVQIITISNVQADQNSGSMPVMYSKVGWGGCGSCGK
jgi:hypothetical protein